MTGTADATLGRAEPPDSAATSDSGAPEERLAAAFGRHVGRWSRERGASAAAALLAAQSAIRVSRATSEGHSCLALDELLATLAADTLPPPDLATLRARLLDARVVGTPQAPDSLPLILDDQRLYLHRYYDYECRLARALVARSTPHSPSPLSTGGPAAAGQPDHAALSPAVAALLERLFAPDPQDAAAPDWQKIAVRTALLGRLTVISGGPGTGKTTTVANLLACLLETDPDCRIALTAPTGKAAARMVEVIRRRAGHLPDALRARLPTASSTIHRLLDGTPEGRFRHHAGNELPIDVLIVDEASMLDLALAVHLLEAVPQHAKIILLGDKDQLAAVESGAVFSELSARPAADPIQRRHTALDGRVIWLQRNHRFAADSAIGLLATDANAGNAAGAIARLGHSTRSSLSWLDDGGAVPSPRSTQAMLDGYDSYIEAMRNHGTDPRAISAAFARFRVLCAVRDGPWGVNALNQLIGGHVRRALRHAADPGARSEWYPGRPVMVLRNDRVLQLFNGDIGIVLPDAEGVLQVWFADEHDGFRAIAPVRLPEHETAFAATVHKAQGSEFDAVLLALPAEGNRILSRELFYTAVTRARERLTVVAEAAVVAAAINTPTRRASGLSSRLRIPADGS